MRRKDLAYIREVPLSQKDFAAFERLRGALENISAAKFAAILLHHAIWHPTEAVGELLTKALAGNQGEPPA